MPRAARIRVFGAMNRSMAIAMGDAATTVGERDERPVK
jgi:hypothetical protein